MALEPLDPSFESPNGYPPELAQGDYPSVSEITEPDDVIEWYIFNLTKYPTNIPGAAEDYFISPDGTPNFHVRVNVEGPPDDYLDLSTIRVGTTSNPTVNPFGKLQWFDSVHIDNWVTAFSATKNNRISNVNIGNDLTKDSITLKPIGGTSKTGGASITPTFEIVSPGTVNIPEADTPWGDYNLATWVGQIGYGSEAGHIVISSGRSILEQGALILRVNDLTKTNDLTTNSKMVINSAQLGSFGYVRLGYGLAYRTNKVHFVNPTACGTTTTYRIVEKQYLTQVIAYFICIGDEYKLIVKVLSQVFEPTLLGRYIRTFLGDYWWESADPSVSVYLDAHYTYTISKAAAISESLAVIPNADLNIEVSVDTDGTLTGFLEFDPSVTVVTSGDGWYRTITGD